MPTPRVLFVLPEPGYFRLHGTVIRELAARGWDVRLAFDRPDKRGDGIVVPPGAPENVRFAGALPWERDWRTNIVRPLRLGLDYVRYLEPRFARAEYLRRRAEKHLPRRVRVLKSIPRLPAWVVTLIIAAARAIEHLVPVHPPLLRFIRGIDADVVVVSPVVVAGESGVRETEVVKIARRLGLPTIVAAASWDHLTSKGLIRIVPDRVIVWNAVQLVEAADLHRIPRRRISVTGAQSLDYLFAPVSPERVDAMRRTLGVRTRQRVLLYVGSSRNMAPGDSEVRFVRSWIAAVRASGDPAIADAFLVVRPHPGNTGAWKDADLGDAHARIWPRSSSPLPLPPAEIELFKETLALSDGVVGINTTAMIESAIARRPVFSIEAPQFVHSQQQTLHFGYLDYRRGGCVMTASTLEEHVGQLSAVLRSPAELVERGRQFVQTFVRPHGPATSATACVCDAIEDAARFRPPAEVAPAALGARAHRIS